MSKTIYNGYDVDLDQLVMDLKKLAEELKEGEAVLDEVEVDYRVQAGEHEEVAITLAVGAFTGSRFSGGYLVPYDSE